MASDSSTRLLAICCGLDAESAGIIEALGRLPAPPGVCVRAYRAASAPGGETWEVRDGSGWRVVAAAQGIADLAFDALLHEGRHAGRLAAEMLLVAAPDGDASHAGLTQDLEELRARFQRVEGVTLVALSRFQPATRTAKGRLTALPPLIRELNGSVDRVVLLDEMDLRGVPAPLRGGEGDTSGAAVLLAECAFGELAPPLRRAEEANRGLLGGRGHFLSIGFASCELHGEGARRALAEHLAAGMLRELPGPEEGEDAAPGRGDPTWRDDAARVLWPPPAEPESAAEARREAWLARILDGQKARLRARFEQGGWTLRALEQAMEERSRALAELPDRGALELSHYMRRFVPRYAEFVTGRLQGEIRTRTVPRRELVDGRVAAFMAALIVCALGAYGVYAARGTAADLGSLAASLTGAAVAVYIALVLGFWRSWTETFRDELPPPDPREELHRYRDANWVANRLAQLARQELEAVRANLRTPAEPAPAAVEPVTAPPVPPALCTIVLEARGLTPRGEVEKFWRGLPDAAAMATGGFMALCEAVRAYALRECGRFDDLTWSHLADLLAARAEVGAAMFEQLLGSLWEGAAPRIGLEGLRSGSLAAVPRDLPPAVREHISERLGRPTLVESPHSGRVALLRYTQGYEIACDELEAEGNGLD